MRRDIQHLLESAPPSFIYEREEEVDRVLEKLRYFVEHGSFDETSIPNYSAAELTSVYKAVTMAGGHWYRCPNGHYYAIGECGQAMQTSVCPDCAESIGGERHNLLGTNSAATDLIEEVTAIMSRMQS